MTNTPDLSIQVRKHKLDTANPAAVPRRDPAAEEMSQYPLGTCTDSV